MKTFRDYVEELPIIKDEIESSRTRQGEIIDKPLNNREKGMVYKPFKEERKRLSAWMKENREKNQKTQRRKRNA
jgi:hypothetical protein